MNISVASFSRRSSASFPLAEVYDRVEFDQPPPAPKLSVVKEESEAYLS